MLPSVTMSTVHLSPTRCSLNPLQLPQPPPDSAPVTPQLAVSPQPISSLRFNSDATSEARGPPHRKWPSHPQPSPALSTAPLTSGNLSFVSLLTRTQPHSPQCRLHEHRAIYCVHLCPGSQPPWVWAEGTWMDEWVLLS